MTSPDRAQAEMRATGQASAPPPNEDTGLRRPRGSRRGRPGAQAASRRDTQVVSAHTRACAHAHDCYIPVAASMALAPDELRGLLASGTEVPGPTWTHPRAAAVRAGVCGPGRRVWAASGARAGRGGRSAFTESRRGSPEREAQKPEAICLRSRGSRPF